MTVLRYLVHLHRTPSGEIDDITIEPRHGTVDGNLFLLREDGRTTWIENFLAFENRKDALDCVCRTIDNRLRVWEKLREACSDGDVEGAAKALGGLTAPTFAEIETARALLRAHRESPLAEALKTFLNLATLSLAKAPQDDARAKEVERLKAENARLLQENATLRGERAHAQTRAARQGNPTP